MNDTKVCIVSLIGKSQLLHNQTKAWKLNSLIQKNYFKSGSSFNKESKADDLNQQESEKDEFGIETYHDTKNKVIYIHLESIYDANNALELLLENSRSESPATFFEIWEQQHIKYLRSILLLFSISHIIIISSPSCEFDIGYIRFFRIIETLRNKMLPSVIELIKSLNLPISKEWLYAGRPCSPRVLFTFENCPSDIISHENNDSKQSKMLEKLQHSLEDQIYNSLRKSYVITNISNNSLFSIPANQEFAYIHRLTAQNSVNTSRFLLSNLFMECSKAKDATNLLNSLKTHAQPLNQSSNYLSNQIVNNELLDSRLFRKFVFEHVKTALTDGFNDNIGRTNVMPVFELPTVNCFDRLFDALCDFFLNEPKSAKIKTQFAQIKSYVDTESQFSENRCKKVLPNALNLYQENLPGHYTKNQHQQKLEKAINFYSLQARGPMYNHYLEQLTTECINIWQNGRQLCEAISLTEHPCIYNLHRLPTCPSEQETQKEDQELKNDDLKENKSRSRSTKSRTNNRKINHRSYRNRSRNGDESTNEDDINSDESSGTSRGEPRNKNKSSIPPIKSHNSNIVTIAASNCGEFQLERKDPFELKEANFTFYEEFAKMVASAKKKHIKYEFQLFKPTENAFPQTNQSQIQTTTTQPFSYANLSQEQFESSTKQKENDKLFPSPLNEPLKTENDQPSVSPIHTIVPALNADAYLPGMTHSESPSGLLPRFSSWSLVSIGKNSHYSIHNGLNQPGLLTNHNYLIPWDIIVSKHSAISSVDKQLIASRKNSINYKKNESISSQVASLSLSSQQTVTVRAYIGMEYECPCGHRFFCSGPDKISKVSSNGNVKDDAYKLLFENMPLYTACPCRKETPYMAQMMRVFIVTPASYVVNLSDSDAKYSTSASPPPSSRRNISPIQQNNVKISIQINPRVQPSPTSPIFYPSCTLPINLAENSIWVLRLPYIYMNDSGEPFYRPKDFETLKNCRVLKGMFSAVVVNN